jgi:hypothetical protein
MKYVNKFGKLNILVGIQEEKEEEEEEEERQSKCLNLTYIDCN